MQPEQSSMKPLEQFGQDFTAWRIKGGSTVRVDYDGSDFSIEKIRR